MAEPNEIVPHGHLVSVDMALAVRFPGYRRCNHLAAQETKLHRVESRGC
jgi:hypothetical protein